MDEERALSQPVPDGLLYVIVIVKRPLLALRYMLPNRQIRKIQMNFVPHSGCDVALENFRAAGLPIRDKDLPQLQSPHPQLSQSQPRSKEGPGFLSSTQATRQQLLQGAVTDSSQPVSQESTRTHYSSLPQSAKPTKVNVQTKPTPGGVVQDEFSRPISAPSRSMLNTSGSTITVTSVPLVLKPRGPPALLPSPVFNGTYEPFGTFQVRPMSAPEQTQAQRHDTSTTSLSEMFPPARGLPNAEKKVHPLSRGKVASQEDPSQEKSNSHETKTKRKAKPRIQRAKPIKPKGRATAPSQPLAPSSPSLTSRLNRPLHSACEFPETPADAPSSSAPLPANILEPQPIQSLPQPSALASKIPIKRPLTDQSIDQSNKRQLQTRVETEIDNSIQPLSSNAVAEQIPNPSQVTDPLSGIRNRKLLARIDDAMKNYYGCPAPKPPPRTLAIDHLADYAAQSEEDRVKPVNDLMAESLKDDDFSVFMGELEEAWKKIGLSLGVRRGD